MKTRSNKSTGHFYTKYKITAYFVLILLSCSSSSFANNIQLTLQNNGVEQSSPAGKYGIQYNFIFKDPPAQSNWIYLPDKDESLVTQNIEVPAGIQSLVVDGGYEKVEDTTLACKWTSGKPNPTDWLKITAITINAKQASAGHPTCEMTYKK